MILKRLLTILTIALGAAGAQAATFDNLVPVSGGPTVMDTNLLVIAGAPSGLSYVGGPTAIVSSGLVGPALVTATLGVAPDTLVVTSLLSSDTVLSGSLVQIEDGAGMIQALFSTTGGTLAASFGDLFFATFTNALFTDSTLDAPGGIPFVGPTGLKIEAVNVIPLPATGLLLIGALGGAFAIGRRRA